VSFELAQKTGKLREEILKDLKKSGKVETAEKLADRLEITKSVLLDAVREVEEHVKGGAPLPTHNHILVEGFDKYLIIHACFGEIINRTLGGVFDAVLSDRELIVGWWNDGYRILIETSRKLTWRETEKMAEILFSLTSEGVEEAFREYLEARFPFSYKMKFVAERFGALPRGKTMGPERLRQLPKQFQGTPVYDETLREAMVDKVDIEKVKEIMMDVKNGKIRVSTIFRDEKPTPLAYQILEKYSDISELMAPERVLLNNIERMKKAIEARTITLLCLSCGKWTVEKKIKNLPEQPTCEKCQSKLLALLYPNQNVSRLVETLEKRQKGKTITEDELRELAHVRRTADLILSYGKKAVTALKVKGIGPETAFRILGKMHSKEEDFYMDLLKAKIQYLRTREYWETGENSRNFLKA